MITWASSPSLRARTRHAWRTAFFNFVCISYYKQSKLYRFVYDDSRQLGWPIPLFQITLVLNNNIIYKGMLPTAARSKVLTQHISWPHVCLEAWCFCRSTHTVCNGKTFLQSESACASWDCQLYCRSISTVCIWKASLHYEWVCVASNEHCLSLSSHNDCTCRTSCQD